MSSRHALSLALVIVTMVSASACDSLPALPIPFGSEPVESAPPPAASVVATPTPAPPSTPPPIAAPAPAPTEPAFDPFWVKNHTLTEMWSGPTGAFGVISFGITSQQFCSFLVVQPQTNERLYVFNPYSDNYFWIDASAVGPTGPPERRPGPKPANQNCAEAVHGE